MKRKQIRELRHLPTLAILKRRTRISIHSVYPLYTLFVLHILNHQVSYILYLVDEDWDSGEKPDGGGLQLYPLEQDGVPGIPAYAPSKTIRPRWNQMVLFAVQPGRSFHDVQEVRATVHFSSYAGQKKLKRKF